MYKRQEQIGVVRAGARMDCFACNERAQVFLSVPTAGDVYKRQLLLKNIEYPILAQNNPMDTMRLDELVELMLDVVCSKRAAIRIAGENMPAEVVKSRFLKLNAEHIQYVLDCLKDNPPRIRNIKQYLLAALYNAPLTIENYYAAQIDHDLCGGKR